MKKIISILSIFIGFNLYASNADLAYEAFQKGDYKKTELLLQKACDDNDMKSCHHMGVIYMNGLTDKDTKVVITIDTKKGIDYLTKACDGGSINDCINLGNIYYRKNSSVNQDLKKAKDFFKKACEKGEKQSCYTAEGLNLIKPISKTNSEEIIKHNGFEYQVIISPTTGRKWLDRNLEAKRACKNNLDEKCLGTFYEMDSKTSSNTMSMFTTKMLNSETWLKSDGTGVCPKGFKVPSGLVDFNLELETMGNDEFLKFLNLAYHEKNEKKDSVERLWSSTLIDEKWWFLHFHKDKEAGNRCEWNGYDKDRLSQIRCVEAN